MIIVSSRLGLCVFLTFSYSVCFYLFSQKTALILILFYLLTKCVGIFCYNLYLSQDYIVKCAKGMDLNNCDYSSIGCCLLHLLVSPLPYLRAMRETIVNWRHINTCHYTKADYRQ